MTKRMPKVKFIKEQKEIEVPAGANLREEALKAGIPVYNGINKFLNCYGNGTCGTCRVLIKNGTMKNASPKSFFEKMRLNLSWFAIGCENEVRLSCKTKVMGDIEVYTRPEWNISGQWGK